METSNGCRPTDSGAGPRIRLLVPLLVAFKNAETKQQVMMNVRNLKTTVEKFRGIGISHDLNPKERDDIKHMIQEAKQAHENLGTDATENYRFLVVGHGLRRKVLKIKRH